MVFIEKYRERFLEFSQDLLKWIIMGVFIGTVSGFVGGIFHHCLSWAASTRTAYPKLVWTLPFLGMLIVLVYHSFGMKTDRGANRILDAARNNEPIPPYVGFSIFISTILTQLGGGSAGREGAALQIGGSIGSLFSHHIGPRLHVIEQGERQRVGVTCGMAGMFSALFGTPVGATIFSIEVCEVAAVQHIYLLPTLISSVVAHVIANALGAEGETLSILTNTEITPVLLGKTVLLALLCAMVSIFFCSTLHTVHNLYHKIAKTGYIYVWIGGSIMIASYYLFGSEYLGAGMNLAEMAVNEEAQWYSFLVKIILTAVTLGAGFKGGEIVPSFAIGASFGCVVGPLLGISPSLAASLGMIAVFCGVVNCPLASILLSIELFGSSQYLILFVIACSVSMVFSGSCSLYSSQTLLNKKILLPEKMLDFH